jgi:hypothetical protein
MKIQVFERGFKLWLSTRDTYVWAHRPHCFWPCSTLSAKSCFVEFDSNGLCDFTLNGRDGDCDGTELSAIVADHVRSTLPVSHQCYGVAVGQFEDRNVKAA